jgi:N-acylethanolamine-hydrolysing acid amidase
MMRIAATVLLGGLAGLTSLAGLADAQRPGHGKPCVHGKPGAMAWTEDAALREATLDQLSNRTTPKRYTLNMDLPPERRWDEICAIYRPQAHIIHDYLKDSLGSLSGAMGIIEDVAAHLDDYKGFGDYAAEMRGISRSCGLALGDVVAGNLVYQLEGIGINCSNWNNTGPTGQCGNNQSGVVYMESGSSDDGGPGACTSMVAEDERGHVFHGRNLDWNLPPQMRQFIMDIEFQKGGETQFIGTTLLGGTGLMAAMKPGAFTFSNDARCEGGKLLENIATMVLTGAETPSHHARRVFDRAATFEEAVKLFSTGDLIDEVYYIVGGAAPREGAIITRDRLNTADIWRLGGAGPNSWFRLQTNYDHWEQPPSSDDRRTPGDAHMVALGQRGVGAAGLLGVLTAWPNFNHHTDYSGVMSAKTGLYNTTIWMGEGGGGGGGGGR